MLLSSRSQLISNWLPVSLHRRSYNHSPPSHNPNIRLGQLLFTDTNNTVNICAPLRHKKVCSTEIAPRLYPCWLLAQGPALLVHYKSGPGWAGLYSTLRNNYAKIDHLYTTCQSPAANSISSYQHAINHTGVMWKPSTSTV